MVHAITAVHLGIEVHTHAHAGKGGAVQHNFLEDPRPHLGTRYVEIPSGDTVCPLKVKVKECTTQRLVHLTVKVFQVWVGKCWQTKGWWRWWWGGGDRLSFGVK